MRKLEIIYEAHTKNKAYHKAYNTTVVQEKIVTGPQKNCHWSPKKLSLIPEKIIIEFWIK